jgi:RHS repeat-associated protein
MNDPQTAPAFGFAGMQYHAPSGLYLTKYRAYDPETGRWLSRDPIEEARVNLYAYVEGNPMSWIDPLGLPKTGPFYGLSKKFWNWFHKQPEFKDLKNADGLVDPATAKDYYKERNDLGMPNPRDKEWGVIDPDILEWLIPWWLTPSSLACPKGEPGCPCE